MSQVVGYALTAGGLVAGGLVLGLGVAALVWAAVPPFAPETVRERLIVGGFGLAGLTAGATLILAAVLS